MQENSQRTIFLKPLKSEQVGDFGLPGGVAAGRSLDGLGFSRELQSQLPGENSKKHGSCRKIINTGFAVVVTVSTLKALPETPYTLTTPKPRPLKLYLDQKEPKKTPRTCSKEGFRKRKQGLSP